MKQKRSPTKELFEKKKNTQCNRRYIAEADTWKGKKNLKNTKELLEEFKRNYRKERQRIKEDNKVFNRRELPRKYTAKLLYEQNNGKFETEYLKKLERN